MDRITSNQVSGLMEAYASVYAPQELTEEQVWEEVEGWVNSLLEEGYDLSEYTWEDMYEAYLSEMPNPNAARQNAQGAKPQPRVMTAFDAGGGKAKVQQLMRQGVGGVEANRRVSTTGEYLQKQAAKPQPQLKGLSIGQGGFRINNKPVQTGQAPSPAPARPTVPAAKPAAPAAARPTAPAPKAAPAAPAASSIERRIPTSAELKQAQQLRTTGANLTGTGALAPKPAAAPAAPAATSTPAPAAAPKPNLQQSIRNRRLNMDLDLFDVIKGHLLDEGYADSEEAALKIMANMSEEWREEILEGSYEDRIAANNEKYNRNRQRAAQRAAARNAARDAGKTGAVPGVGYVTPRRESETYIDSSGTERHKSGAKMPKKEN